MDTFDAACRRADRLSQDFRSNRGCYEELNKNHPTPSTAIEAIKHAVRDRGIAALKEPATRNRLQQCDAAARAAIDRWLTDRGKCFAISEP